MLLSLLDSSAGGKHHPLSQCSPPSRRGNPPSRDGPHKDSGSSEDEPATRDSTDDYSDSDNAPNQDSAHKGHNVSQADAKADQGYFVPRSSPVTCRRKRLSRPRRSLAPRTPACRTATPSPSRKGGQTAQAGEALPLDPQPHPLQPPEKPRCVSLSANLTRLLGAGLHLPFKSPGQEEGPIARSLSEAQISPGTGLQLLPQMHASDSTQVIHKVN